MNTELALILRSLETDNPHAFYTLQDAGLIPPGLLADRPLIETPIEIRYDDDKHKYWIDGEEVVSVSQILDRTSAKDALPWWGMRVGMASIVTALATTGWAEIANANTPKEIIEGVPAQGSEYFGKNDQARKKPKTLVEALALDNRVTTNHIKEDAGARGTNVHAAMEAFAVGKMPDAEEFPVDQRGYVQALAQWWLDHEPEFLENEVIVGSRIWRYAGRFDTVVRYQAGPHKGKRVLADLKTSKSVYLSHLKQLVGYKIAYLEMGAGDPFDELQVVHADKHGNYNIVPSSCSDESFTAAAMLYHADCAAKDAHRGIRGVML